MLSLMVTHSNNKLLETYMQAATVSTNASLLHYTRTTLQSLSNLDPQKITSLSILWQCICSNACVGESRTHSHQAHPYKIKQYAWTVDNLSTDCTCLRTVLCICFHQLSGRCKPYAHRDPSTDAGYHAMSATKS